MDFKRQLEKLQKQIIACTRCPRLVRHCRKVAKEKRRMYRDWEYWGKPNPSFGDPNAELLILGLAPAAHGGNRTGRMFTGDRSGDFLYRGLYEAGWRTSSLPFPGMTVSSSGTATSRLRYGVRLPRTSRCPPRRGIASHTSKRNCACSLEFAPSSSWVGSPLRLMCGWWRRSARIFHAARHSNSPMAPISRCRAACRDSSAPTIPASRIPKPDASRRRCFRKSLSRSKSSSTARGWGLGAGEEQTSLPMPVFSLIPTLWPRPTLGRRRL